MHSSSMSGTRFSGIAVAAANRRALVNQEREAAQRDASHVKTLNPKEEALLASIRSQLLGGGKKSGGGGAPKMGSAKTVKGSKGLTCSGKSKGSSAKQASASKDGVRRYDDLDDLEDDAGNALDGDSDGETNAVVGLKVGSQSSPPSPPPPMEKRFLSKAERKRLKKQRLGQKTGGDWGGVGGDAEGIPGTSSISTKKEKKRKANDDDEKQKKTSRRAVETEEEKETERHRESTTVSDVAAMTIRP